MTERFARRKRCRGSQNFIGPRPEHPSCEALKRTPSAALAEERPPSCEAPKRTPSAASTENTQLAQVKSLLDGSKRPSLIMADVLSECMDLYVQDGDAWEAMYRDVGSGDEAMPHGIVPARTHVYTHIHQ